MTRFLSWGGGACALPARRSVCILIFSCVIYGGPLLSACPRTHFRDIFVFLFDVRSFLAVIMASASGLERS
jgi:hypothetical protein